MPGTPVSRDQFEWEDNRLVHKPTNARFAWSYPNGESESYTLNWGSAGDRLSNGEDYDREDVVRVAKELLLAKKQA
jgi:hypothetical protein